MMTGTVVRSTLRPESSSLADSLDELRVRMVEELRDSFLDEDLLINDRGECCFDGDPEGDLLMTSRAWAEVESSLVDTLSNGDRILSEAEREGVFCTGIRVGTWGPGGPSIVLVTVSKGFCFRGLLTLVLGVLTGVPCLGSSFLFSGEVCATAPGDFLGVDEDILLSAAALGVLFSARGT
jgi:hypothetical protein